MGNRGRHDVKSHVDAVRIVTAKWSIRMGPHGLTGSIINSTEGIPTITCGGAAEPSVMILNFDPDSNGRALAPQLLWHDQSVVAGSGTFAASFDGVYHLAPVTGSSVSGQFIYRLISGTLPNAGNVSPGTAVPYSASLDPGLTGSMYAVFRGTSRSY